MSDPTDKKKSESNDSEKKLINIDKNNFGGLAPLTAAQVIALFIKTDVTMAGPCY
ncbi:MAG: hypothetical protein H7177_09795 [Rhizobacter sp.]|nr:hypothetical protein [Bacteriovorax sp.]